MSQGIYCCFFQVNILLALIWGQLCVCLFPLSKSNSNLHSSAPLCSSHEPIKDTYSLCSLYNLFHLWEDCAPAAHSAGAHFTVWQIASNKYTWSMKKKQQQHSSRLNWSKTSKKTKPNSKQHQGTLIGNVKPQDKPLKALAWHGVLIFRLVCTFGNATAAFELSVTERHLLDYSDHPFSQPRLGNTFGLIA